MFDPSTDQPKQTPETPPSNEQELSKLEQSRQELDSKQKTETEQVGKTLAKNKSETVSTAASARADLLASMPLPTPETPAPTASPDSTNKKSFGDQIKEFFGKFTAGLGPIGEKISSFFKKFFQPKDQVSETPFSPTDRVINPPVENIENYTSDFKQSVESEAKRLNIDPAFALAIISVESGKKYYSDAPNPLETAGKPPLIRFEPHIFNQQLAKSGNETAPGKWGTSKLVGRNVDGVSCEGGQNSEIACLNKAININREAAFNSISMGMGQIMGFNAKLSGYTSAEEMFKKFGSAYGGMKAQILGMFKVIENSPAHLKAAQNKDFSTFARLYNGASVGTKKHDQYMAALQSAYNNNSKSPSALA
jgi:hypothetical protein